MKPIDGFPGYFVTIDGSIISTIKPGRYGGRASPKTLVPGKAGDGYLRVTLCRSGQHHHKYIHVIVLETFRGRRPDGYDTCHKNGVKIDNRLINLRWGTRASNAADRLRHGTALVGEKNHRSKLTKRQALQIKRWPEPRNGAEVGRRFGISSQTVRDIWLGRRWRHL